VKRRITMTGESCPFCGDDMTVMTDADQDHCPCGEADCDCERYPWWAFEGDDVICLTCGCVGVVSCDGDEA
jgi:hypothetical protein